VGSDSFSAVCRVAVWDCCCSGRWAEFQGVRISGSDCEGECPQGQYGKPYEYVDIACFLHTRALSFCFVGGNAVAHMTPSSVCSVCCICQVCLSHRLDECGLCGLRSWSLRKCQSSEPRSRRRDDLLRPLSGGDMGQHGRTGGARKRMRIVQCGVILRRRSQYGPLPEWSPVPRVIHCRAALSEWSMHSWHIGWG
jgi:hypothetical protein